MMVVTFCGLGRSFNKTDDGLEQQFQVGPVATASNMMVEELEALTGEVSKVIKPAAYPVMMNGTRPIMAGAPDLTFTRYKQA